MRSNQRRRERNKIYDNPHPLSLQRIVTKKRQKELRRITRKNIKEDAIREMQKIVKQVNTFVQESSNV